MNSDFGRPLDVGPGEGDCVLLFENGLLRDCRAKGRPFGAGALMVAL
jgi:hypothetical protein